MRLILAILVCTVAILDAGRNPEDYIKAVEEYLKNPFHLTTQAKHIVKKMMNKEAIDIPVDISFHPKLELLAKISKKKELYSVEVSLKKPKSIKGLSTPIVTVQGRSDLKKAVVDSLKQFLQSFSATRYLNAKYRSAARKYLESSKDLDAQANIFTSLIDGKKQASKIIIISSDPLLKIKWKFVQWPNAYEIVMFLDQRIDIRVLNTPPIIVKVTKKSKLKGTFIVTLKEFLLSIDSVPIVEYIEAVKKYGRQQILEQSRHALKLLYGKDSIEGTILISKSPRLKIGWKIEKNLWTGQYAISMHLAEPKKIARYPIPNLRRTTSRSALMAQFVALLDEILQSFLAVRA